MPALRAKGIAVEFHQARRNGRGITVTSTEYRETPDLKPSSTPPHNSLQPILAKELKLAREDSEQRERDFLPRLEPTDEDYEDMEFWANVENLASPDDMSFTDRLDDGGGLDI